MRIKDVEIQNFMPYRGVHKIRFPDEAHRNVMVIFGDNMRGKTSLLNAIRWCFYGTAFGRNLTRIRLLDIANIDAREDGDWGVSVAVSFEANGVVYDLRRHSTLRAGIDWPRTEGDFEVVQRLTKDGQAVRGDLIEHEINQVLPEQISRFFLFDAELLEEYEVLLSEGTAHSKQIRDAIEQVLGVPALINGRNDLRVLLKKAQSVLAQENKHVEGLQSQADQYARLQAELEALAGDAQSLSARDGEIRTEIAKIEEILKSGDAALRAQGQIDALKSQEKALNERQKGIKDETLKLATVAWKDLLQPRLRDHLNTLNTRRASFVHRLEQRGEVMTRMAQLREVLDKGDCALCGAVVPAEVKRALGADLGTLEGEIRSFDVDMDGLSSVSEAISALSSIHAVGTGARFKKNEEELSTIAVQLTAIEGELEDLERQIAGADTAELARQRSKRDQLLQNLGKISHDLEQINEQIEERTTKQNQLSRLMSKAPAARTRRSAREVEVYGLLEKIFAKSIDGLRDRLRESVAEGATEAFLQLTTERTYKGLAINQNYGLTIIDHQDRPVNVRSAGAEQIVALALIAGLRKTSRRSAPVIIDTPLGRLDPKHRLNVLSYLPQMTDQLVLLVHEGEIARSGGLDPIADRVGATYQINRVSATQSEIIKAK